MLHGVDDESEMERETQLLGRQTSLNYRPSHGRRDAMTSPHASSELKLVFAPCVVS